MWRRFLVVFFLLTIYAWPQSPRVLRIGVPPMANSSTRPVNARWQRDRLVRSFAAGKKHKKPEAAVIQAVPLESTTPGEIAREARDKNCDYILYTELVELRGAGEPPPPNRPGSITIGSDPLARYPGPPAQDEPVFYAVVDYRLQGMGDPNPMLDLSASGTEHADENETVARQADRIASRVKSELAAARPIRNQDLPLLH